MADSYSKETMDAKLDALRSGIRADFGDFRTEVAKQFGEVKVEVESMRGDVKAVNRELRIYAALIMAVLIAAATGLVKPIFNAQTPAGPPAAQQPR